MTGTDQSYDVIIVGAGIAGGALASVLARAGQRVLLLEKTEAFVDHVRGEAIVPWGVKEAQDLGLHDALIAAGAHYVTKGVGYDELIPAMDVEAAPTDMGTFVPGVPGILAIGHPRHCQTLLDAARAAGAEVRRDIEIVSLAAGPAPAVVFDADGVQVTAHARLIVGADGRTSRVREALGIPLAIEAPRTRLSGLLVEGADGWNVNSWVLGTEGDFCFAVFPQGGGRARVYGWWDLADRKRFHGGAEELLAAFNLACCPPSGAIAGARAAGPMTIFVNNETVAETPYCEGAVLIGDAAGWTDPISGLGLACAYRDARVVSEILLASDDWSPAAFAPYAQERNERLRRLRFVTEIESAMYCDFSERGRARRGQFFQRLQTEPEVAAHLLVNLAGPEAAPAGAFTPAHRAYVLGEA